MPASKIDIMIVSFTGDTGLTDYSASLCRELAKLSTLELVTAQSFDETKYQADYKITKLFRRTRQFPLDIWKFVAHVIHTKPRAVLFQGWMKSPVLELPLVLLFRALGIRVILTVHDLLPHYPKPWSRLGCAFYYRAFNALVVHSQRQLHGLHALGVRRNTLVVPHGVYDIFNTQHLCQADARHYFPTLASDDFTVLFFGHLDERKGLVDFLAAAELLQTHKNMKFVVAGKPDGRANTAQALAAGKQFPNTVIDDYMIEHQKVQRYFAACDVVALPYREGTTSGVMKLAMAFGKPVICTDVGDFSESVAVWSGLLIERRKLPLCLAEGLLQMQDNFSEFEKRTHSLAKDIQWDAIAKKYATHALP